jgi:hypothetical protein
VIDQAVAELAGDRLLQLLDFFVAKLDDVAGIEVDEVVVVLIAGLLVAGAAFTVRYTVAIEMRLSTPEALR